MGKITGICISEKRGTSKHPVDEKERRKDNINRKDARLVARPFVSYLYEKAVSFETALHGGQ